MSSGEGDPLGAIHPHEPEVAATQLSWLLSNVKPGHRVLDLGCGACRTLIPLVAHGATCTGVDRDGTGLVQCREALAASSLEADLVNADFRTWLPGHGGTWDVVCCLGNTFCLLWQIDEAVAVLRAIRDHLADDGMLILDDIPGDLWPEVAQGSWQEGLDPESGRQMVWAPDDAVFAIRDAERADPGCWELRSEGEDRPDTPMRLWTAGAMQLAAQAAGFTVPVVPTGAGIRVLTPAE